MKLLCTQDNFKKAISNCERVVLKKNTLPVLNNILFETKKGGLKMSATNLEIGISVKIGAKIEKEGKITIPARLVGGFAANLSGDDRISLEVKEDKLKIKSGPNSAILRGLVADDFPLIPSKKTEFILFLSGIELKNTLLRVMSSAAINEARQELTGINLTFSEKELFFAATDSFRLAEHKIKLNEKNIVNKDYYAAFLSKKSSIIIPLNTLLELVRVISDEDNQVKIAIEEGQIFFDVNGTKIVSRLVNGKYPDYKQIIPANFKTRIVGGKTLFLNAIRMANVFSSRSGNEITLKIDADKKKIFIQSSNAETGENTTELNFDTQGPSLEVLFNSRYFLEGINAATTEQVAVLANSATAPVAIKEIDAKTGKILDDFIYIVMPIKN